MGLVVKKIGSAGAPTRDFTTIQAWHDSLPSSLVTDGNSQEGDCYNDSEFNEAVTFSGKTTDSTHTITLTTGPGQSFRDNANVLTNALKYNQSNGVAWTSSTSYALVLDCGDQNVAISKLQIKGATLGSAVRLQQAGGLVDGCLIDTANNSHNTAALEVDGGTGQKVRNCMVIQRTASKTGIAVGSGGTIENCTVVVPSGTTGGTGVNLNYSGTYTLSNCLVFGFTNALATSNSASVTPQTCQTDQATPPTGFTQQTYANEFIAVDGTNYQTKALAPCLGAGTTLADVTVDILGRVRQAGTLYDIGAQQLVPTTTGKKIGSNGAPTRDFSTLQAWHDAAPGNLISNALVWEGDCFNDSEFLGSSTPQLHANGHTTDTTHFMRLTTGAGQSFRDNANVQTNALRYNVANGVGIRCTSAYTLTLQIDDENFHMSNLQVSASATNHAMALDGDSGAGPVNIVIDECILEGPGLGSAFPTAVRVSSRGFGFVRNTLIVATMPGSTPLEVGNGAVGISHFINCTIVQADQTNPQTGVILSDSSVNGSIFENCAIFVGSSAAKAMLFGSGADPSVGGIVFTTCASDSSQTETGLTSNASYANSFQNISTDYRLKSGSPLIDVGTTDATNAARDVVGTARPQGSAYDIGAWEFVQAAAARPNMLPIMGVG